MMNLRNFIREEEGMGTVEIILIIVVLIMIVTLFRDSIKKLVNDILQKITNNAKAV